MNTGLIIHWALRQVDTIGLLEAHTTQAAPTAVKKVPDVEPTRSPAWILGNET